MSRSDILANINRSWDGWSSAMDGIPNERKEDPGVCGYYSVKDLMGHIAFWDEQDLARAHRLARGEEVEPNDWATMNDVEYETHKDDTIAAQEARMREAHARLVEDAQVLDRIDELKLEETWEHYDAHREDVLAWRAAQGI